jgi:hypothetical protein
MGVGGLGGRKTSVLIVSPILFPWLLFVANKEKKQ